MLRLLHLDLLVEISQHLEMTDLVNLSQVNRQFYELFNSSIFWQKYQPNVDINRPTIESSWPFLLKYSVAITQTSLTPSAIHCLDLTLILERCLERDNMKMWNYFWPKSIDYTSPLTINYRRLAITLVEAKKVTNYQQIFNEIIKRVSWYWGDIHTIYFLQELQYFSGEKKALRKAIMKIYPTVDLSLALPPALRISKYGSYFLSDPVALAVMTDDDIKINQQLEVTQKVDWCQVATAAVTVGRKDLLRLVKSRCGFMPFPKQLKDLASRQRLNLSSFIEGLT